MPNPTLFWAPAYVEPQGPLTDWWLAFEENRDMYQPRQQQAWTCSACSIDWVALATQLDPDSTRELIVGELGYPICIDEALGLKDTRCAIRVMERWGVPVQQEWLGFDRAYELCAQTTGILNSTRWFHFVAIRGVQGDQLWIANSARGYMGIDETISRAQFEQWAGSWQAVYLLR